MPGWQVRDADELGFCGVEEVRVYVDHGVVNVERTSGPTTCSVRRLTGDPVGVHQSGGLLRVVHPALRFDGWEERERRDGFHAAEIRIRVAAGASVRVVSSGADVIADDAVGVVVEHVGAQRLVGAGGPVRRTA